jgi:tetratricopeptide (TPR) repeat protein
MSEEKLSFWAELKRRRVYRTAAWYAASIFVVWQVADILIPSVGLPAWTMKAIVILSAIGFIPTLILSWIYDVQTAAGTRLLGRPRVIISALALVIFGVTGFWVARKVKPRTPELSEVSLAVFPFSVRLGNLSYLREGLVDLLSRSLSGTSDLQPIDPSLMLKVTEGQPTDAPTAGTIARQVGARRFVLGSVSASGARVRIDATVYALKDSAIAGATRMVEGDTTELFSLVDQLSAALLAELTEGAASEGNVKSAVTTTRSLPALKAYLKGEQAFRQGRHPAAVAAFQEASALDSTFVFARYRLAVSYQMNEQYWLARNAILEVMEQKEQLLPHDQRVADAFMALQNGSVAQAEREFQAIVNEFPRDLEARVLLADLLLTYNRYRAESQEYAVELLESVLYADPKFVCILCRLAEVTSVVGQYDKSEHLYRQLAAAQGNDSTKLDPVINSRLALFRRDSARARTELQAFDSYRDSTWYDRWLSNPSHLAIGLGNFSYIDAVQALPRFGRGDPIIRAWIAGQTHTARGELKRAQEELTRSLLTEDPASFFGGAYAVVTQTPFEFALPAPEQLHDMIARVMPDTSAAPINELARAQRGIRIFMLGLVGSRTGDAATTAAYVDSLSRLEQNPLDAGVIRNARLVLLADRALRENKPDAALSKLDSVSLELRPGQLRSWYPAMEYGALLRIRAYVGLGRNNDALKWLRYNLHYFGSVNPQMHYGIYQRDMANVLDRLGRREEAMRYYTAFVNAWQNADPELQPQVAAARQRLTELLPK